MKKLNAKKTNSVFQTKVKTRVQLKAGKFLYVGTKKKNLRAYNNFKLFLP